MNTLLLTQWFGAFCVYDQNAGVAEAIELWNNDDAVNEDEEKFRGNGVFCHAVFVVNNVGDAVNDMQGLSLN